MNRRLSDNVKHIGNRWVNHQPDNVKYIGPFELVRLPAHGKVFITITNDGEGGPMPLADFLREVGPWEEIGEGDGEKIQDFYSRHF